MKKYLIVIFSTLTAISLCYMSWLYFLEEAVFFASLESKGIQNQTIYNKINFFKKDNLDIWMMNQSHFGINTDPDKIDRLAIVVDKLTRTTKFYQLPPGDLIWSDDLPKQKIEFRVSCFMCHANGPRAIRPNYELLSVNVKDRIKINLWNYKIKSYRRLQADQMLIDEDKNLKMPFRYGAELDNQKLNIKTCSQCHNNKNGRGDLTRQNLVTINFLLKNKLMPPAGYELSDIEKSKMNQFFLGL